MKIITKYVASDGEEFNSESSCAEHEQLIKWCDDLMKMLPELPKDDGCEFANGNGYIQHEKEIFETYRMAILKAAQDRIDHEWISQTITDDSIHPSWVGKLLYEHDYAPLYNVWIRVMNTDKDFREYGQGYYAANPHEAKGGAINIKENK